MNSIKLWNRVDTIFINSKNSKTSNPHRLLLNLSDKIDLRRSDKCVALWNLSITIHGKMEKKHVEKIDNPSVRIYVNKIEDRITFKIKTGYYLQLLPPETMKLLGSNKIKITKGKNGENMPNLEIT